MQQQRFADLEQQLQHAESAALEAETNAAQLDARQNEARAIDLKSTGKLASFAKPVGTSDSSSRRTAALWMRICEEKMEEASRSEVPMLTGSMRQEADRSRQLHCMLVRWWSDGGHGERA